MGKPKDTDALISDLLIAAEQTKVLTWTSYKIADAMLEARAK